MKKNVSAAACSAALCLGLLLQTWTSGSVALAASGNVYTASEPGLVVENLQQNTDTSTTQTSASRESTVVLAPTSNPSEILDLTGNSSAASNAAASASGTDSAASSPENNASTATSTSTATSSTSTSTSTAAAASVSLTAVSSVGSSDFHTTASTLTLNDEKVESSFALLADLDTGAIIAQKNMNSVMNPASMTKVLTLLVAAENVQDPEATVTITSDIPDYVIAHDASNAGYSTGEQVKVKDLFYATAMPSAADAVLALTRYTAGSESAFVDLMNQKASALGLSSSAHFTNASGLYNSEHHLTPLDMVKIMKAAMDNVFVQQVTSQRTYVHGSTTGAVSGKTLSNLFLRRIDDKLSSGKVISAKTGYVSQSGNCAVSYYESASGKHYIAVTGKARSSWRAIYDHVALYQNYTS